MAKRQRHAVSLHARLAGLERRTVLCRACAAAGQRSFRVLPADAYEAARRAGGYAEVCSECGVQRPGPLRLYHQDDWDLLR